MQYLVFEGVRDSERLIRILLRITDCDIQCAPGLVAVVLGGSDPGRILDDPGIRELDDVPGGFWSADVFDRTYFLDRVEEACRRTGKRRKNQSN